MKGQITMKKALFALALITTVGTIKPMAPNLFSWTKAPQVIAASPAQTPEATPAPETIQTPEASSPQNSAYENYKKFHNLCTSCKWLPTWLRWYLYGNDWNFNTFEGDISNIDLSKMDLKKTIFKNVNGKGIDIIVSFKDWYDAYKSPSGPAEHIVSIVILGNPNDGHFRTKVGNRYELSIALLVASEQMESAKKQGVLSEELLSNYQKAKAAFQEAENKEAAKPIAETLFAFLKQRGLEQIETKITESNSTEFLESYGFECNKKTCIKNLGQKQQPKS